MTGAPRPVRRARRRWTRLAGWIVAALVVTIVAAAGATPGSAQAPPPSDGTLAGGPIPLSPEVIEVLETTTFVAPVDVLSLALRLDGAPPGATLELRLHNRVTAGRFRLHETMAGDGLGGTVRAYPDLVVADLPRDASGVIQLDLQVVDTGTPPLAGFRLDRPGVYPLELTVSDADGGQLDRLVLHVVRLPEPGDEAAGTPLAVATTVRIDAPLALRADGTAVLDERDVAGIERSIDALVTWDEVPVSIAPTPETLEALAQRDRAAGTTTVASLADALIGRQVLARPWVALATSSWPTAGDPGQIPKQLDAGLASVERTLGVVARRGTWLIDPTVDPGTLTQLRDLGVDQVVIPEGQLSPLPSSFDRTLTRTFLVRDGAGQTLPAAGSDARLEAELRSGDQPAVAANRVLTDLAVLHLDEGDSRRGAVLDVPSGAATPAALEPLLAGLAVASEPPPGAAPVLEPVTLDGLFAATEAAVVDERGDDDRALERTWAVAPPVPLGTLPGDIARGDQLVASYRTMLPAGDDASAQLARDLLLAAADRDSSGEARQGLLDAATTVIDTQVSAISAPEQGSVTLTASEGSIPVVLENGGSTPMRVRLTLTAEKLEFPDGDIVDVDLQPGTNRLEIRVRTRASGAFPAEVAVSSPDGQLALVETRVQVRSTAVSGLGLVLSVAAGLFLAAWWAKNLRSSRRSRSLVSATHPSADPRAAEAGDHE